MDETPARPAVTEDAHPMPRAEPAQVTAPGSEALPAPPPHRRATGGRTGFKLAAGLYVFIGALQIMKAGAGPLADALTGGGIGGFLTENPGSTFGIGWLMAMVVLSGTPVVATALSLSASDPPVLTELEGFTMATGGRMGAAFIVLLVGVMFAIRGGAGERVKAVSTAVLALVITAVMYVPGAAIGIALLRWQGFDNAGFTFPASFSGVLDFAYGWLLEIVEAWPPALLFVLGVLLVIASLRLIDSIVPKLDEASLGARRLQWLQSKWPMFFLGLVVVILTLSVSVALTVLVPLVHKKYVKRENLIPYIVGADIGTLVDKLLVALLLHSEIATRIILAEIIGVGIVGVAIMVFAYQPFKRGTWRFQRQMVKSKPRLAMFTAALFIVPISITIISGVIG